MAEYVGEGGVSWGFSDDTRVAWVTIAGVRYYTPEQIMARLGFTDAQYQQWLLDNPEANAYHSKYLEYDPGWNSRHLPNDAAFQLFAQLGMPYDLQTVAADYYNKYGAQAFLDWLRAPYSQAAYWYNQVFQGGAIRDWVATHGGYGTVSEGDYIAWERQVQAAANDNTGGNYSIYDVQNFARKGYSIDEIQAYYQAQGGIQLTQAVRDLLTGAGIDLTAVSRVANGSPNASNSDRAAYDAAQFALKIYGDWAYYVSKGYITTALTSYNLVTLYQTYGNAGIDTLQRMWADAERSAIRQEDIIFAEQRDLARKEDAANAIYAATPSFMHGIFSDADLHSYARYQAGITASTQNPDGARISEIASLAQDANNLYLQYMHKSITYTDLLGLWSSGETAATLADKLRWSAIATQIKNALVPGLKAAGFTDADIAAYTKYQAGDIAGAGDGAAQTAALIELYSPLAQVYMNAYGKLPTKADIMALWSTGKTVQDVVNQINSAGAQNSLSTAVSKLFGATELKAWADNQAGIANMTGARINEKIQLAKQVVGFAPTITRTALDDYYNKGWDAGRIAEDIRAKGTVAAQTTPITGMFGPDELQAYADYKAGVANVTGERVANKVVLASQLDQLYMFVYNRHVLRTEVDAAYAAGDTVDTIATRLQAQGALSALNPAIKGLFTATELSDYSEYQAGVPNPNGEKIASIVTLAAGLNLLYTQAFGAGITRGQLDAAFTAGKTVQSVSQDIAASGTVGAQSTLTRALFTTAEIEAFADYKSGVPSATGEKVAGQIDLANQINQLYQFAYNRAPTRAEVDLAYTAGDTVETISRRLQASGALSAFNPAIKSLFTAQELEAYSELQAGIPSDMGSKVASMVDLAAGLNLTYQQAYGAGITRAQLDAAVAGGKTVQSVTQEIAASGTIAAQTSVTTNLFTAAEIQSFAAFKAGVANVAGETLAAKIELTAALNQLYQFVYNRAPTRAEVDALYTAGTTVEMVGEQLKAQGALSVLNPTIKALNLFTAQELQAYSEYVAGIPGAYVIDPATGLPSAVTGEQIAAKIDLANGLNLLYQASYGRAITRAEINTAFSAGQTVAAVAQQIQTKGIINAVQAWASGFFSPEDIKAYATYKSGTPSELGEKISNLIELAAPLRQLLGASLDRAKLDTYYAQGVTAQVLEQQIRATAEKVALPAPISGLFTAQELQDYADYQSGKPTANGLLLGQKIQLASQLQQLYKVGQNRNVTRADVDTAFAAGKTADTVAKELEAQGVISAFNPIMKALFTTAELEAYSEYQAGIPNATGARVAAKVQLAAPMTLLYQAVYGHPPTAADIENAFLSGDTSDSISRRLQASGLYAALPAWASGMFSDPADLKAYADYRTGVPSARGAQVAEWIDLATSLTELYQQAYGRLPTKGEVQNYYDQGLKADTIAKRLQSQGALAAFNPAIRNLFTADELKAWADYQVGIPDALGQKIDQIAKLGSPLSLFYQMSTGTAMTRAQLDDAYNTGQTTEAVAQQLQSSGFLSALPAWSSGMFTPAEMQAYSDFRAGIPNAVGAKVSELLNLATPMISLFRNAYGRAPTRSELDNAYAIGDSAQTISQRLQSQGFYQASPGVLAQIFSASELQDYADFQAGLPTVTGQRIANLVSLAGPMIQLFSDFYNRVPTRAEVESYFNQGYTAQRIAQKVISAGSAVATPTFLKNIFTDAELQAYADFKAGIANPTGEKIAAEIALAGPVNQLFSHFYGRAPTRAEIEQYWASGATPEIINQELQARGIQTAVPAWANSLFTTEELTAYSEQQAGLTNPTGLKVAQLLNQAADLNQVYRQYMGRDVTRAELEGNVNAGKTAQVAAAEFQGQKYIEANQQDIQYYEGAFGKGRLTEDELKQLGQNQAGLGTVSGQSLQAGFNKALQSAQGAFQGTLATLQKNDLFKFGRQTLPDIRA